MESMGLITHPLLTLFPSFFKIPTESNKRLRHQLATVDMLVADILAKKHGRAELDEGGNKRADVLDLILARSKSLSDKELHDNIFTFFLAGHETSATTLSMTLYNLALSQDWQTQV